MPDRDLIPACARILSRSFAEDPYVVAVFANAKTQAAWLEPGFQLALDWVAASGGTVSTNGPAAMALFPPGNNPAIQLSLARSAWRRFSFFSIPWGTIWRVAWTQYALSLRHPKEPHWYVMAIGTDPAAQGQGFGATLLRPLLDRADRDGTLVYLESANPKNLAFYLRNGFRPAGEVILPGGEIPTIYLLVRKPGSPFEPGFKLVLKPTPKSPPINPKGRAIFGLELALTSLFLAEIVLHARVGKMPDFLDALFLLILLHDAYHWKKALRRWKSLAATTRPKVLGLIAAAFGAMIAWQAFAVFAAYTDLR